VGGPPRRRPGALGHGPRRRPGGLDLPHPGGDDGAGGGVRRVDAPGLPRAGGRGTGRPRPSAPRRAGTMGRSPFAWRRACPCAPRASGPTTRRFPRRHPAAASASARGVGPTTPVTRQFPFKYPRVTRRAGRRRGRRKSGVVASPRRARAPPQEGPSPAPVWGWPSGLTPLPSAPRRSPPPARPDAPPNQAAPRPPLGPLGGLRAPPRGDRCVVPRPAPPAHRSSPAPAG
jgi:hypothetical protein